MGRRAHRAVVRPVRLRARRVPQASAVPVVPVVLVAGATAGGRPETADRVRRGEIVTIEIVRRARH